MVASVALILLSLLWLTPFFSDAGRSPLLLRDVRAAMSLRDFLFYEEPGITLYCGDCRRLRQEVLAFP